MMTNPYLLARRLLGFTQIEVATSTGLTIQSIRHLEQGMATRPYREVTKFYMRSLKSNSPVGESTLRENVASGLVEDYYEWVYLSRKEFGKELKVIELIQQVNDYDGKVPWRQVAGLIASSTRGVARKLFVSLDDVQRMNEGVPVGTVYEALMDVGFDTRKIYNDADS